MITGNACLKTDISQILIADFFGGPALTPNRPTVGTLSPTFLSDLAIIRGIHTVNGQSVAHSALFLRLFLWRLLQYSTDDAATSECTNIHSIKYHIDSLVPTHSDALIFPLYSHHLCIYFYLSLVVMFSAISIS